MILRFVQSSIAATMLLSSGCANHSHHESKRHAVAASAPTSDSVAVALQNLIAEPPETVHPQFSGPPRSAEEIAIPAAQNLAADGTKHIAVIDRESNVVLIMQRGGIGDQLTKTLGPWRLENPKVSALLTALDEYNSAVATATEHGDQDR